VSEQYHDQQEREVRDGARVAAFLADPAVKQALVDLETGALLKFKAAKTDDELRAAQAIAKVVDEFARLLKATADRGVVARRDVETRQAREKR
jgi:hypothetical protein